MLCEEVVTWRRTLNLRQYDLSINTVDTVGNMMSEPTIAAGTASAKITPPVGVELTGYAGRPGPSAGVHDELYAKALVLDDGSTRVGILSLDLLGLTSEDAARIRTLASAKAGLPPGNLLVTCSHTHAGPAVQFLRCCGTPDPDYVEWMVETSARAVGEAASDLAPAEVLFATSRSDIGMNRRAPYLQLVGNPEGAVDDEVGIMLIAAKDGRKAVVYNYPCHGVVLGHENVLISADWMGAASRAIEDATGARALFLQGCGGDINPRLRGGFDAVEQTGQSLAAGVVAALEEAVPAGGPLAALSESVELPLLPPLPPEQLAKIATDAARRIREGMASGKSEHELSGYEAQRLWAQGIADLLERKDPPRRLVAEIQAIRIGGVRIVALPGEAFAEIGLQIKSFGEKVLVAAYANGNIGYIPTARAYLEGGYEVDSAYRYYGLQMIGPESEAVVVRAAARLLSAI